MTVRKYGVLDESGVKINTITLDEEVLKTDWYPGYGAALIDEGEIEPEPPPDLPKQKPATWDTVLPALAEPMQNGDAIDFITREVVKAKPVKVDAISEVAVEAVADEAVVKSP